ncbi:hypothetical protein R6Q57_001266 [Mikania cordata]
MWWFRKHKSTPNRLHRDADTNERKCTKKHQKRPLLDGRKLRRAKFFSVMGRDSYRMNDKITGKWRDLQRKVVKFNKVWIQHHNNRKNGENDETIMNEALMTYAREHVIFSYRTVTGYEKINKMKSRPEVTNLETDEDVTVRKIHDHSIRLHRPMFPYLKRVRRGSRDEHVPTLFSTSARSKQ